MYHHFRHSPRASAAIFLIAERIFEEVRNYENGDFRDHVERMARFHHTTWCGGEYFEFDAGDVYIATLNHAWAGDFRSA